MYGEWIHFRGSNTDTFMFAFLLNGGGGGGEFTPFVISNVLYATMLPFCRKIARTFALQKFLTFCFHQKKI